MLVRPRFAETVELGAERARELLAADAHRRVSRPKASDLIDASTSPGRT